MSKYEGTQLVNLLDRNKCQHLEKQLDQRLPMRPQNITSLTAATWRIWTAVFTTVAKYEKIPCENSLEQEYSPFFYLSPLHKFL